MPVRLRTAQGPQRVFRPEYFYRDGPKQKEGHRKHLHIECLQCPKAHTARSPAGIVDHEAISHHASKLDMKSSAVDWTRVNPNRESTTSLIAAVEVET